MLTKTAESNDDKYKRLKALRVRPKGHNPHWPVMPLELAKDPYLRAIWWILIIGAELTENLGKLDSLKTADPRGALYRKLRGVVSADRALLEFWVRQARKWQRPNSLQDRPRLIALQHGLEATALALEVRVGTVGPGCSGYVVRAMRTVLARHAVLRYKHNEV